MGKGQAKPPSSSQRHGSEVGVVDERENCASPSSRGSLVEEPPRLCRICCIFRASPVPSHQRWEATTTGFGRMWLASPFSHLCSAAATPAPYSTVSVFRQLSSSALPRALARSGISTACSTTSQRLASATHSRVRGGESLLCSAAGDRRRLLSASCASGDGGAAMVPDDASALLGAVYDAKPTPQVCVTTTG